MTITLFRGDITERPVDAIINGANAWLVPGGGVDGAIHRVGGEEIQHACEQIIEKRFPGGLTTGHCVATPAGELPARWVIHAVGPIFSKTVDRSHQLVVTYRNALKVADELGAKVVACPALSTGAHGFPSRLAGRIAIEAVRFAKTTSVREVQFVLIEERNFNAFATALIERES